MHTYINIYIHACAIPYTDSYIHISTRKYSHTRNPCIHALVFYVYLSLSPIHPHVHTYIHTDTKT